MANEITRNQRITWVIGTCYDAMYYDAQDVVTLEKAIRHLEDARRTNTAPVLSDKEKNCLADAIYEAAFWGLLTPAEKAGVGWACLAGYYD